MSLLFGGCLALANSAVKGTCWRLVFYPGLAASFKLIERRVPYRNVISIQIIIALLAKVRLLTSGTHAIFTALHLT